jgi:phosphoglycerate dehydrogenase-like enzyme
MSELFRVGVTRDTLKADGTVGFSDVLLRLLDNVPALTWDVLPENTPELRPDQVRGYDALLVLFPRISAATLEGADRLTLVARLGVGYDRVDVDACTARGVMLSITPDGVRRPMAASILSLLLALSHKLLVKDRLTRTGRWDDRLDHMGMGLTGRVLGSIGLGNIGREMFRLAAPLGMRHMACDPYVPPPQRGDVDVEMVSLEELLRTSDFLAINCPLNSETRHMIDAGRLAMMKPSAYLINTARGPIVDEEALVAALQEGRLRGAGVDVFDQEPVDPSNPLLTLDNVIVTPHALGWTDEMSEGIGRSACTSILDVAAGRVPAYVVNRAALDNPRLKERLSRYGQAWRERGR